MTDHSKELLRQGEEALKYYLENFHQSKESGRIGFDASQALASLRAMLEGDAGEDERDIRFFIQISEDYLLEGQSESAAIITKRTCGQIKEALSRLSAKAKVGEAEIREAKREVLEEVRGFYLDKITQEDLEMNNAGKLGIGTGGLEQRKENIYHYGKIVKELDQKLAALKEAGK